MNTAIASELSAKNAGLAAAVFLVILVGAVWMASAVQRDFGDVSVSNVTYLNTNGIPIRGKLFVPADVEDNQYPGVVYVHGYQNNRETGDAYCIELGRRGFVVLNIDAIGRGNSGNPGAFDAPDFDETFGARRSLAFLRDLPFVDASSVGLMGHSLGAEMVYQVALEDPSVQALVITGFAYREDASYDTPRNMLMIMGQYDEFRDRMTGTDDIQAEWMSTPQTKGAFDVPSPQLSVTYGSFEDGTARRVYIPNITHVMESHHSGAIAETVTWMKSALGPDSRYWKDPAKQIWQIKEIATLLALITGLWVLIPLAVVLLEIPTFGSLTRKRDFTYVCEKPVYWTSTVINGVVMCLYLPFILILFAVHLYVVPIDRAFPLMMMNGIVWWFLLVNVVGLLGFKMWRNRRGHGVSLTELGVSYRAEKLAFERRGTGKSILFGLVLFLFAFAVQGILERIWIVDYRFIFPFASDLTWNRVLQFLKYFPFLLIGFSLLGASIHGKLRREPKATAIATLFDWSAVNVLSLTVPLLVFLAVQYVPLLGFGAIPLVGPSGMFIPFLLDLFHIIGVLILVIPISTWLYQLTGKIYVGAVTCAAIVTWMFVSSQVIAPIPV